MIADIALVTLGILLCVLGGVFVDQAERRWRWIGFIV